MKKIKHILLFVFCSSSLLLTSCDSNDDSSNSPSVNPSGDYWPTAVNNEWMLKRNGTEQYSMKIIGTDTFNGLTYYKFAPQSGNGSSSSANNVSSWLNKNNGVYTMKVGDLDINGGGLTGVQTGYEMVLIKDLAVGETWSGSYNQETSYTGYPAITQTTNYKGTMEEKGISLTVNGVVYNDVIKVHIYQETSTQGSLSIVNTDYWFAKNVGLIKQIMYSGNGTYESILENYVLN